MEQYKKEFIEFMVDCGVLTFGDFVTKSGRKTPFFINAGNFQTGAQLARLGEYYARAIHDSYGTDFDVLFGPAYKGITLAVSASMALSRLYAAEVRYSSNRKEVKDHGDVGSFLGCKISGGDRVVMIEDVTTAGTSIRETLPLIMSNGEARVMGLVIAVDRMERGQGSQSALAEIKQQYGIPVTPIVTMGEVVQHLHNREYAGRIIIDDEMKEKIDAYYELYGVRA